jgi:hypothetical protein
MESRIGVARWIGIAAGLALLAGLLVVGALAWFLNHPD